MKRIVLIVTVCALIFCGCGRNEPEQPEASSAEVGVYGEAIPVTRDEAARMLALCLYDYEEILSLENKANFADVTSEDKLYKYINAVYGAGLMSGDGVNFRPGDYLTVGEASVLISAADTSGRLKIETEEASPDNPISYYVWMEILEKLGEAGVFQGAEKKEMTVLMTEESAEEIEDYIICKEGLYRTEGFVSSRFENTSAEFLVKNDSIIGIFSVTSDSPVFDRCLVLECDKNETVLFYGGCKKTYKTEAETESKAPFIADVQVKGDRLISVERYTSEKYGRVIAVGENILFDDDYSYAVGEDLVVYSVYDGLNSGGAEKLISGSTARVIFKDNKAVCALCKEKPDEDVIRVALSSKEGSLVHKNIEISSDRGFSLKSGESETDYDESAVININDSFFRGKKLSLTPENKGKININGVGCEGRIDVIAAEGGYNLVCEMPLNTYLYGVVCGEMPAAYGEEALKAQALAARSYAYNQKAENKRIGCGANIDDTTAFQVYNPDSVCDEAVKAVDETEGEMIIYNGKVINACFYSTSCGIGANSGEVWSEGSSKTPEYLSSRAIGDLEVPDFSNEEEALKFFKTIVTGALETDCPYYRWSFKADKASFKTDVGAVKSVEVKKRGQGGNVTEIAIRGEKGEVLVKGETNIRSLLAPGNIKLNDGSVKNFSDLPSSFFAVEEKDGEIYFYGGGFGHGAGMSQNGAKALAAQGKSYKEIIEYFYMGTSTEKY